MRKSRFGGRKEKTVMLLSSVFVLAALTATGLFIRGKSEEKQDGYVVDFSAIEAETAKEKELAQNMAVEQQPTGQIANAGSSVSDDLDYDPYYQEANSQKVENPAIDTVGMPAKEGMIDETKEMARVEEMEKMEDTMAIATSIQPVLTFSDKDTLAWPVVGNVLINYSMDKTVYFPTLQQYKYNPALIISAVEGETITAAADGKVIRVFSDPELGNGVTVELGGGYEITYGQLKDITVSEGGYINKGDIIGSVAAPTKYYILEGSNIYFKLTKDGTPINPMTKLS